MSEDAGSAKRVKINPSLLIGLGGQGQKSLVEIHRRLESTYGCIPPQIRLMALDTDGQEGSTLDSSEFHKLEVRKVWSHIESNRDDFDTWMDLENIPRNKHRNINKGAGQIRQIGRFALQYHIGDVQSAIAKTITEIDSVVNIDDDRWDTRGCPRQIVFCGSIAGGTGAGTLLDLACAARSITGGAEQYKQYAYLVLPGVFRQLRGTHYVEENAYALLRELDFFLSSAEAIERGDYGDRFEVDLGGSLKYTMSHPFDDVMLVDNYNTADLSFATPDRLAEAVALAVFTTLGGPIGEQVESVRNNPENQGKPWDGGMLCNYSSFGVAELYYPREEVIAYARANFAEHLIAAMDIGQVAEGDEGDVTAATLEAFLASNKLQERGTEDNEIVDAILAHKPFTPRTPDPRNVKTDDVERIWQDNDHALQEYVEAAKQAASAARAQKAEDAVGKVRTHIDGLIASRGGNAAAAFIMEMQGYFDAVRAEMVAEHANAKSTVKQHRGAVNALKDTCKQKAGKRFGRKEAVRDSLSAYAGVLQALARAEVNALRTGEARTLCSAVQEALKGLARVSNTQRASLENLVRKAAEKKKQARESLSSPGAFRIPVQPDIDSIQMPEVRIDAFYRWLSTEKGLGALDFWDHTADDAMGVVLEYADHMKAAEHPAEMTLAGVLATKTDDEVEDYAQRVHLRAEPLLPWDTGADRKKGRRGQEQTETIYLIGASPDFFEFFTKKDDSGERRDLSGRLSSLEANQIDYTEIDDPDRAYFFRRFGSIPAYALGSFHLLRNEYLEHQSIAGTWSLHLDKRWDEILPDLDPAATDADSWIWAIAASDIEYLSCVQKSASQFTLEYEQPLPDGATQRVSRRLGQGYEQARKTFLDNREWVSYAQNRIEQGIAEVGNARALEDLASLRDSLADEVEKAKKSREEQREQAFQRDVHAVAEYRKKLQ